MDRQVDGEGRLTFKEAAREFRVSVRQIRLAAEAKQLAAVRVGRSWVVKRSAIDAWLDGLESKKGESA